MSKSPTELIQGLIRIGQIEQAEQLQRDFWFSDKIWTGCIPAEKWLDKIITQDERMLKLKEDVLILGQHPYPVLITGQSGTGKELIARALHGFRLGPFVAINCTSMPDELIESELFGHKKGAFTGALEDRVGKFEHAQNGTLFLDEIGDMPMNMQTKLLRAIQFKKITRVGDNKEIDVSSVRIVSATNQNITDKDRFREDLLWRLNVFNLATVPLGYRREDIYFILTKLCPDFPKDSINLLSSFNEDQLRTFFAGGNVRILEAWIARWKVFKSADRIL